MKRLLLHSLLPALAFALLLGTSGSAAAQSNASLVKLRVDYQRFLDRGPTPKDLIGYTLNQTPWRVIDPEVDPVHSFKPGERLVFVNQGRTALFVVVGKDKLEKVGARLIAAHIDTPSPRLFLGNLSEANQSLLTAGAHGGIKGAHWLQKPVAIVGQVIKKDGTSVDVRIGEGEDFSFLISERSKGNYSVIASSAAPAESAKGKGKGKSEGKSEPKADQHGAAADQSSSKAESKAPPQSFVALLFARYGIDGEDLRSSELYVVPKMKSRAVGIEGLMVGSHGQDDRSNSYLAWRAISNLEGAPERTAITWLVDREESGSRGRSGARSHYLELVYSYLLRSQGKEVSELALMRAFAASEGLSADTPACVNPNWPEVHEEAHGPILGKGPVMFPGTGRGGKFGGSQAHAELVQRVLGVFTAARVPVQTGELGRVDEGGGGTVAKYLEHRGIDIVDIGVCVIGMHSPFEISSVQDLAWGLRGFEAWLRGD